MKILEKIKRIFKKKKSLRERCVEAYGEEFGEIYDRLGSGEAIGNFNETITIITMIQEVEQNMIKNK